MKKIRINELARDLEIKANLILDLLPELGVTEKKTHSSSIDEDVAEEIRLRILGSSYTPRSNGAGSAVEEPEVEEHEELREEEAAVPERTPAAPERPSEKAAPAVEAQPAAREVPGEPAEEERVRPTPRMPIRPPLASTPRPFPQAPAMPSHAAPAMPAAPPQAPSPQAPSPPTIAEAPEPPAPQIARQAPQAPIAPGPPRMAPPR